MAASTTSGNSSRLTTGPAIVGYVALAKLAPHLGTAAVYGFFIDSVGVTLRHPQMVPPGGNHS